MCVALQMVSSRASVESVAGMVIVSKLAPRQLSFSEKHAHPATTKGAGQRTIVKRSWSDDVIGVPASTGCAMKELPCVLGGGEAQSACETAGESPSE